ncbi:MAG: adenylosuccinate synthase [Candidatus Poribacteria bacterium]|nr:adenylosuccinate synthase [Candidatus Poribacteria bacterium]
MRNTFIVGSQWGDESKGKFVDFLAEQADVVARAQGGPNAGHTIVVNGESYVFHLLPSGILHRGKLNVIGNGVVIDVPGLLKEMDSLATRGFPVGDNLEISDRAHLIMPYHKWIEHLAEENDKSRLGTTRRGVGPAYADKARRVSGIRMCDLMEFDVFQKKFLQSLTQYTSALGAVGETFDAEAFFEAYRGYAERLRPHVTDTTLTLSEARKAGKSILFEGAQGSLLDVDFGSYPYVTSSNTTVGGVCTGLGVPPQAIEEVVAVVKAYTTRVGDGPFPTEMDPDFGETVRQAGNEYGATTGRPRRCGWLDIVGLRYASRINGFTQVAVAKLDVLDNVETIKICVEYRVRGELMTNFPAQLSLLDECEPVYEEYSGWMSDTTTCRSYADLPETARRYIERMEELIGVPVTMVSVGPDRAETIHRR